jgi:hypothetical protein
LGIAAGLGAVLLFYVIFILIQMARDVKEIKEMLRGRLSQHNSK